MKTKSKIIVGSILVIALCVSLIAGTTFALFTSESKVDISVTAGKVDVSATVDKTSVYTKQLNKEYAPGLTNTHSQDVKVGDHSVAINGIMPGDGVKFDIVVANNSNPTAVKYRTVLAGVQDAGLFKALKVTLGDGAIYDGSTVYSAWTTMTVPSETVTVEIVLPDTVGNDYMGKECSFTYSVEAVQGNADTTDGVAHIGEGADRTDYLTLQSAFDAVENAQTVFVDEDIVLAKGVVLNKTLTSVTIDGQNHTVSGNIDLKAPHNNVIKIGEAGNPVTYVSKATIKDITIKGSGFGGLYLRSGASHNLENVNIEGEFDYGAVVFYGSCGGTVTNCSFVNTKPLEGTYWDVNNVILTKTPDVFTNRSSTYPVYFVGTNVEEVYVNSSGKTFPSAKVYVDEQSYIDVIHSWHHGDSTPDYDVLDANSDSRVGVSYAPMYMGKTIGLYRDMLVRDEPVFVVTNADGLQKLNSLLVDTTSLHLNEGLKDCTVRLANDIDLAGMDFEPIGTEDHHFLGTFDGNGKTISNLTIGSKETKINDRIEYAGLFGYIGYTEKLNKHDVSGTGRNLVDRTKSVRATIKDFNLQNVTIYAQVAGGVVGSCETSTVQNVTVTNALLDGGHYVGGIGGYVICESVIDKCTVTDGNFKASLYDGATLGDKETDGWDKGDKVGGVVGLLQGSTITNCVANDIDICGYRDIGGIVGVCNDGNAWKIGGGSSYKEDPQDKTEDSYLNLGCFVTGNNAENIRLTFNDERIDADNAHENAHAIVGRNNCSLNGRVKNVNDHAVETEDNNKSENVTLPQ